MVQALGLCNGRHIAREPALLRGIVLAQEAAARCFLRRWRRYGCCRGGGGARRIEAGLPDGPSVALVTVTVLLLLALSPGRIHEYILRAGVGNLHRQYRHQAIAWLTARSAPLRPTGGFI